MKTSKNQIRSYIVLAILFAVIQVIVFAIPFDRKAAFWIGYVFAMVAILVQVYVLYTSFGQGGDAKSKFYGFPIAKIGVIYLMAQLVVSLIEMALAFVLPGWIAVIVNVILLAIAAIGCIAAEGMRDEIVRQDDTLKKEVGNMRALQSMAASLVGLCQDEETKKILQDLSDEFKYSDPVSSEQTADQETELKFLVNEIQRALVDGDLEAAKSFCTRTKVSLAERNRICKLGK